MARGWESKFVEEQQSVGDGSTGLLDSKEQDGTARGQREREKQDLELKRERILSQRTSSPVRRAALESALADIEARLALLS